MPAYCWVAGAVLLALAALSACFQCATWAAAREMRSRLERVATDQRGLRVQMRNLISMLLRAGFKRGPSADWSDDDIKTRLVDEPNDSSWWTKKKKP